MNRLNATARRGPKPVAKWKRYCMRAGAGVTWLILVGSATHARGETNEVPASDVLQANDAVRTNDVVPVSDVTPPNDGVPPNAAVPLNDVARVNDTVRTSDEVRANKVLQAVAKLDMKYDSNLFFLADDANTAALLGASTRSTVILTEQAGLKFDKTWSRQHVEFEVDAVHQSFQSFHFLDYSALNYNGKWDWQLGPRLSGTITAIRKEELASYADFQEYNVKNLQTVTAQNLDFDYWAFGNWHFVGGLGHYAVDNPGQFTQVGSFTENTVRAGIRYVSAAGNRVTAMAGNSVGTFNRAPDPSQLLDNHYVQRNGKITVDFRPTGHLEGQVWLGYVDRRYRYFSQRNFNGITGGASAIWTPTGKTQVKFSVAHDLVDYEDGSSSYYATNVVSVEPTWKATPKVSVGLKLEYTFNDFKDPVTPVADIRRDSLFNAELKLEYRATKSLVLTAYVQTGQRSSNMDTYRYRNNAAGMTATLTF